MAPFSLLLCVPLTKHEVYFCHFMLIICTRIYLQVLFTLFHFIFLFFFNALSFFWFALLRTGMLSMDLSR